MRIYIDTREPKKLKDVARIHFGFIPMTMEVGDFGTDKIIFERKKIGDLISSCFPNKKGGYGGKPRLLDQAKRIHAYAEKKNVIPVLLITGSLQKQCEKLEEHHVRINKNAIYGSVASVFTRYMIHVFWTEQPYMEWLAEIKSICEKVDEGKYLLEARKPLRLIARHKQVANISRALEISPRLASRLYKRYGGLYYVLAALKTRPSDVLSIDGIGPVTLKRMKTLGGI